MKKDNRERLLDILIRFIPLQSEIEEMFRLKNNYQTILFEPKLLFKYKKNWMAFFIASRLYNSLKRLESVNISSEIEKIRFYDKTLAETIKRVLLKSDSERIYLRRYASDCEEWSKRYIYYHGIEFFIQRINLFLRGGIENNVRFFGAYNDFADVKLTKSIMKNNIIKNLSNLNGQVKYLGYLISLCKKSEDSGKWEGFFGKGGFWTDFDKYAGIFKEKYGNSDFFETLQSQKNIIHENPEAWGGLWINDKLVKDGILPQLSRKLQHPSYQRIKIILPASLELQRMFLDREKELSLQQNKFEMNQIARLLKRKKALLLNELVEDVDKLVEVSSPMLRDFESYSNELKEVMKKVSPDFIKSLLEKYYDATISNLEYSSKMISSDFILKDLGKLALADGANTAAWYVWEKRAQLIKLGHLKEQDFKIIDALILRAEYMIKNLKTAYVHIVNKINEKYIIGVEDTMKLDLSNYKNNEFKLKYLKYTLKKII